MKSLIIAEKPSVAQDIVRALTPEHGKFTKHSEYFENAKYVVSSAVGHLLEIKAPEEFDVKRGKWSLTNLPVLPPYFELAPITKTKSRLATLVKLIKRKDVGELINACDAGREGELIFRLIAQYAGGKKGLGKPIQRLWLQSMTSASITKGFANLRPKEQLEGLAQAARSRAEADWLIGINGTRSLTAFNSQGGGFFLTTVGRVQTPTLAIVVDREQQRKSFVSQNYWEITAEFTLANGNYQGKWFNPQWKKNSALPEDKANRLWQETMVQDIVVAVRNKLAQVSEETKPQQQSCPPLFDLTSLQREVNARFGFSAKTTLALAQNLYEKHKVLTYPRTDSRFLPEDYLPSVTRAVTNIANNHRQLAAFAQQALKQKYLKLSKNIFNNQKISDHFAIIPTSQPASGLNELEQKLYDFVVKRFLAVFFPPAKFLLTTRISQVEHHHFKTEGKVLLDAGWQAVYSKETADKQQLPSLAGATQAQVVDVQSQELITKPPARYTEATLLGTMEGAGKLIDDADIRNIMQDKGLGTPATRATIIEGLISEKYILREERNLIPTAKAFQLMTLLKGLKIEELCRPQLTGNWEHRLALIERGQDSREKFMLDIEQMAAAIVSKTKQHASDTVPGNYITLCAPCPNCRGIVKENYRRYACVGQDGGKGCGFSFSKIPSGHIIDAAEAEALVKLQPVGPLADFRSKAGWPFAATLVIKKNEQQEFTLEYEFAEKENSLTEEATEEIIDATSLGKCLKCDGEIVTATSAYICKNAQSKSKKCNFKINQTILKQPIDKLQAQKLLQNGHTDILSKFISKRTNKPFKACLKWDKKTQKIKFEFASAKKS